MRSLRKLAFTLILAPAAPLAILPVQAQAQAPTAAREPSLTKPERAALSALETALAARNYAAAQSALSAAQAAARGSEARYYTAGLQLRLGRETNNLAMQASAIDAMLASGLTPAAELPAIYVAQAALASNAGNRQRAEALLTRAFDSAPSADTAISLARIKLDLRKTAEGLALVERAIALRQASGQPVPESWYRRGAAIAVSEKLAPQALRFVQALVAAYPSSENWRDAVLTYREFGGADQAGRLDSVRLARLAKGLAGERDYLEAAQVFQSAGLWAESRSVLDEGVANRVIDPSKAAFKEALATAGKRAAADKARLAGLQGGAIAAATGAPALEAGDLYLSAANYGAAADMFRTALQKGGVDPGVANTRLGIALALAGRRAEAEAAFRAVTGPRAPLASLWLAWLAQRP